ncbi:CLUMA_CG018300, isoform A [Clunio marinus]|uniref:CLUMA_CG018300, isoform A n=1 Tax=Clunio marinus TaxID=568069 RepID=A0A1J1J112_9DIPT|nr:CLUMA_CG018300, isoform A [Clunio marinus]
MTFDVESSVGLKLLRVIMQLFLFSAYQGFHKLPRQEVMTFHVQSTQSHDENLRKILQHKNRNEIKHFFLVLCLRKTNMHQVKANKLLNHHYQRQNMIIKA